MVLIETKITSRQCPECGSPIERTDRASCNACLKKARLARKLRYEQRLLQGLCPECGGPRDLDGFQCSKCRAINNRSQNKIPTEKKTRYQLAYLKRNRKNGLCPTCGRPRDNPLFIYCSKCRARVRNRYHKDPIGYKYKSITRGWSKPKPPVPLCQVCSLGHLQCSSCGKWMHLVHGVNTCTASCTCGFKIIFM